MVLADLGKRLNQAFSDLQRQPVGCLDHLADIHPVVGVRRRSVDGNRLQRLVKPPTTRPTANRITLGIGLRRIIGQCIHGLGYGLGDALVYRARAVTVN